MNLLRRLSRWQTKQTDSCTEKVKWKTTIFRTDSSLSMVSEEVVLGIELFIPDILAELAEMAA